jgi:hypothetical protein
MVGMMVGMAEFHPDDSAGTRIAISCFGCVVWCVGGCILQLGCGRFCA